MMNIHRCRTARVITGLLLPGLVAAASIVPLAAAASAATSPSITVTLNDGGPGIQVTGSGFTPGGDVSVEVESAATVISSAEVVATDSSSVTVCVYGVKPSCHVVTIPGGQFETTLTLQSPGCGGEVQDTVTATDLSTGSVVSEAVTYVGLC
jgi:hypothetical protein